MKDFAAAIFVFTLIFTAALAHDAAHGMKGTVTAIDGDTITIETPKKETQTIHFDDTTKFQKSGVAATIKDLKVGDRVVIQAHDKTGKMHAVQVRFGKPAKAGAQAKSAPVKH